VFSAKIVPVADALLAHSAGLFAAALSFTNLAVGVAALL
jgi:hypothetical protein